MPATHSDFLKMLKDMYEYSKKDPSSIITSSDEPHLLRVGFIVIRDDESKLFNIQLSDYKTSTSGLSYLIKTLEDRGKFCQKDFLADIIKGELPSKPIEMERFE